MFTGKCGTSRSTEENRACGWMDVGKKKKPFYDFTAGSRCIPGRRRACSLVNDQEKDPRPEEQNGQAAHHVNMQEENMNMKQVRWRRTRTWRWFWRWSRQRKWFTGIYRWGQQDEVERSFLFVQRLIGQLFIPRPTKLSQISWIAPWWLAGE